MCEHARMPTCAGRSNANSITGKVVLGCDGIHSLYFADRSPVTAATSRAEKAENKGSKETSGRCKQAAYLECKLHCVIAGG